MKVLIEYQDYPISILENIFEDNRFYQQQGKKGTIISVGYYYSFKNKELVYILPKVFMKDAEKSIFGITKDELLEIDNLKNIKHSNNYSWIRQILIYFYNSLLEYRKRFSNTRIIDKIETLELNTNLQKYEYSYLDLVLSFVNFYKKHKSYILYKHIEYVRNQTKKPKWEKTVRKNLPLISSNSPIYISIYDKKHNVNTEEELITYFFSILNYFNQEHDLFISIDKSYSIYQGNSFLKLQKNGLSKLRKIKYRYFNDTLKGMYNLCEIYFSLTDLSSKKRKRDEFLSTNNYNLIFEDMIDKLFSDQETNNLPTSDDINLKDLKYNSDGKIIDHIYNYQSLMDTSNIFYIGDSKYYKPESKLSKISTYKQFTYAKNVIQFNINLLNENKPSYNDVKYRDDLTEGYNITPNFFIYGYIEDYKNFEDHLIDKKDKTIRQFHFQQRLFDRDTLFIHQYQINFLFVLKSYSIFNQDQIKKFQDSVKEKFRQNIIEFFNDPQECEFEFFISNLDRDDQEIFIEKNFKNLNGKCYRTRSHTLILAKHQNDNSLSPEIIKEFKNIAFDELIQVN